MAFLCHGKGNPLAQGGQGPNLSLGEERREASGEGKTSYVEAGYSREELGCAFGKKAGDAFEKKALHAWDDGIPLGIGQGKLPKKKAEKATWEEGKESHLLKGRGSHLGKRAG